MSIAHFNDLNRNRRLSFLDGNGSSAIISNWEADLAEILI